MIVLDYDTLKTIVAGDTKGFGYFVGLNLTKLRNEGHKPQIPAVTYFDLYRSLRAKVMKKSRVFDQQQLNKLSSILHDMELVETDSNLVVETIRVSVVTGLDAINCVGPLLALRKKLPLAVIDDRRYKSRKEFTGLRTEPWWKRP